MEVVWRLVAERGEHDHSDDDGEHDDGGGGGGGGRKAVLLKVSFTY